MFVMKGVLVKILTSFSPPGRLLQHLFISEVEQRNLSLEGSSLDSQLTYLDLLLKSTQLHSFYLDLRQKSNHQQVQIIL